MNFKGWLYNEMKHIMLEEPIILNINGTKRPATFIDFKWEDFGQQKLAVRYFVQEFPHGVAETGKVYINAGFFDGHWVEDLNPRDLDHLHRSNKVFGDVNAHRIMVGSSPPFGPDKPPASFDVNPLNEFTKIDPQTLSDPDGSPAKFNSPYDKKTILSWWDFVMVMDGNDNVIKQPARIG